MYRKARLEGSRCCQKLIDTISQYFDSVCLITQYTLRNFLPQPKTARVKWLRN